MAVWLAAGGLGLGLAVAAAPASAMGADAECFGALRGPLERGGYGGLMDCSELDVVIHDVGQTRPKAGPAYKVYQLSYRTKTHGWGAPHGGDRILIFDAEDHYLGHYVVMYGQRLRIDGSDVVFELSPKSGNRIHLSGVRPPDKAWIDGEIVGLVQ